MTVQLSLRRPTPGYLVAVVADARATDARGAMSAGEDLSVEFLAKRCAESDTLMHGWFDGEPAGLWGVVVEHPVTGRGDLWFVGTKTAQRHPMTFARVSKMIVDDILLRRHPKILIGVDDWYEQALRWVLWMGFEHRTISQWKEGGAVHILTKEAA